MTKGNLHAPVYPTAWIMNATVEQLILTSRNRTADKQALFLWQTVDCVCESLLCKQLMRSNYWTLALCTVIVVTHSVWSVIPNANLFVVSFVYCFWSRHSWGFLFDPWPGEVSKKCVMEVNIWSVIEFWVSLKIIINNTHGNLAFAKQAVTES